MSDRRRGFSHTLRWRLAAALILTATLSLAVAAVLGARLIRKAEEEVALAELRRQADAIAGEASLVGPQPGQTLRLVRRTLDLSDATLYRITPGGGTVLLAGEPNLDPSTSDVSRLRAGETLQGRAKSPAGEVIFIARPLLGRRRNLAIVLARPAGAGAGIPVGPSVLVAGVLAVGVAVSISLVVSKRIAGPMRELAEAAGDLARGDFNRRVRIAGDDEVAAVGGAFNKMAEELHRDEQRQRDFLMSISHELRTPLTAILGYAEAIEDGTASGEANTQAAGVIVDEAKRLARLVSDLLDLSRLDARRFSVKKEPVDVAALAQTIRRNFTPQAEEAGITIEVQGSPAVATADRDRVVQVLSNLVENALRYTPAGGRILIRCAQGPEAVLTEVADTGPGFQQEDLDHAFERQYLWNKYRGMRDVGTGLGLVITRELVRVMGGEVEAASAPGGGASFTVKLPPGGPSG